MPRPPNVIDRVNYIIDFAEHPCAAPWSLYVETAIPVLGELLLAFCQLPSWTGVAPNYFRPKGIRAGAKGRRKRKRGKKLLKIPDPDEIAAELLPGRDAQRARVVSKGVKHLWIVEGVLERITWEWFLFDLLTEGLYDWCTTVQRSTYCSKSGQPACHAEGQSLPIAGTNTWMPFGSNFANWTLGGATYGSGAINTPGHSGLVVASLSMKNTLTTPIHASIGIAYGPDIVDIDSTTIQPGGFASLMTSRAVHAPGTYVPVFRGTGFELSRPDFTADLF